MSRASSRRADASPSPLGGQRITPILSMRGGKSRHSESRLAQLSRVVQTPIRITEGMRYPSRPDVVQYINVPKSVVNHTYRNFAGMPRDPNYTMPVTLSSMSFHEKLYHLLSSDSVGSRQCINWCPHGRAFEITSAQKLVRFGILHAYFGYGMVQQFRKQLHNYGYKSLTRRARGTEMFYSEFLLRGLPHLLQYSPPPEDRRSLLPDRDNEPKFEELSRLYPLRVDHRALVQEAKSKLEAKGIVIYQQVFETVVARRTNFDRTMNPY